MVGWIWFAACHNQPSPPADPGRILEGPLVGTGLAVSDPDGDGHAALWVSAPGIDGIGGVYRFDGPNGSLDAAAGAVLGTTEGALGGALAPCWDLDGDGVEDLLVGAPDHEGRGGSWWVHGPLDGTLTLEDALFVGGTVDDGHNGAAVACGSTDDGADVVAVSIPDADGFDVVDGSGTIGLLREDQGAADKIGNLETTWVHSQLGFRTGLVLGADLNGDGTGDLVVGGPGADNVHLVFGPFAGSYDTNTAGPTLSGNDGQGAGHALATGDLNGDGAMDLVIGAPFDSGDQGMVWVASGPFADSGLLRNFATPIYGVQAGDQAGFSVAVVGDVDNDGADDLLVGAPFAGGVGPEAGAAYLVLGPGTAAGGLDAAAAVVLGDTERGRLGWAVAGGDIDGDGAVDLVVSAPEADVGDQIGAGLVYTFPGSVRGVVYPEDAAGRITAGSTSR